MTLFFTQLPREGKDTELIELHLLLED